MASLLHYSSKSYFIHFLIINTHKEPGMELKSIVYYDLISIPIAMTFAGLVYMCRTFCPYYCKCCFDLEKKDDNPDYGSYYYTDGVMEVASLTIITNHYLSKTWLKITLQAVDENDAYESVDTEINLDTRVTDRNPEYDYNWKVYLAEWSVDLKHIINLLGCISIIDDKVQLVQAQ